MMKSVFQEHGHRARFGSGSSTTKASMNNGERAERTVGWRKQPAAAEECDPTEECTESSWSGDDHHDLVCEVSPVRSSVFTKKTVQKHVRFNLTPPTSSDDEDVSSLSDDSQASTVKSIIHGKSPSSSSQSSWLLDESMYNKPVFLRTLIGPVTLIQASIRGFLQRQVFVQQLIDREVELRMTLEQYVKNHSATKIQRLMRTKLRSKFAHKNQAASVIQALVRGKVVFLRFQIPLLSHKISLINQAKDQELLEIQANKEKELRRMKRHAARKMEKHESQRNVIQAEQEAEQTLIRKLRKENKKLRAENEKFQTDIEDMRRENFILQESLERLEKEMKKIQETLPKLEADHFHISQVEAQFRMRLEEYQASYEEGGELLKDEQILKELHWNAIVNMCGSAHKRTKELKKRGKREELAAHDETWVRHIRAVSQQMLHRDPMAKEVKSSK